MTEARLVRFLEMRLKCGFMQRSFGAEEMIWSKGAFELLGLDSEKDKPSFSLLTSIQHPDDKLSYAQVEMREGAAEAVSRQFRIIRRDGTLRVLLQKADILYDSNGRPDKLLSVIMDVTDQDCMARRYNLMRARFDAFIRDPGFLTSIVRADGFVIEIRRNNEDDAEERVRQGYSWRDAIHPDDREESLAVFDRAIADKSMLVREHRVITPDGRYQWRRAIWLPVFDEQGELIEFIGLSHRIDKEKHACNSEASRGRLPTGAQVRGARGYLRWSVQELAEAATVSPSAIRRIEEYDGVTEGAAEALSAMRAQFESAGVEFVYPETGKPGVRPA